ncbi:ribonuclease P protein subunit p40 [Genypterus blacodes]|uniref:ribonuclease P protein subunit p40 n=1 Tax=Genypterus blacodes TaxID=154954 RepID=UPI003F7733E5
MTPELERTPRSLLACEISSFMDEKCRVRAQLEQHHFNYKVSVLLPDCDSAPSAVGAALSSFSSFYLIKKLPVYELLDTHFLQRAVHQAHVCGLSYRCRMDEEACVALLPNGSLVLSLDKDSYELLGVEGKASTFNHRTSSRFIVRVNLTDSSMAPGGRGHQRLLTGLRSRVQLQTDFLLSHHPGGGDALQDLLSRYEWTEHKPEVRSRTLTHLPFPTPMTSDLQCDAYSFLEWLGAVDAGISWEKSSSSFLSSFLCPQPEEILSGALSVSVCGLLLPEDIHTLLQELRRYLQERPPDSWAVLTVHGFADSPVSWAGSQHGFLRGGENLYSLLLFHDHKYRLYMAAGAHDAMTP